MGRGHPVLACSAVASRYRDQGCPDLSPAGEQSQMEINRFPLWRERNNGAPLVYGLTLACGYAIL